MQQNRIQAESITNRSRFLWSLLGFAGVAAVVGLAVVPGLLPLYPALLFITILWVGAASTVLLPIRIQLTIFWILLPFVDLLKRVVYLDERADTTETYLVLFTQDIILLTILLKLFLLSLRAPLKVHWRSVDTVMTLFAGYSLLSALMSPGAPLTARMATVGMRVWPMVVYYLAARYLSNAFALNRLVKLTIALTLIVALYGTWQFFIGPMPFEIAWIERAATSTNVAHLLHGASRGVFRTFGTLDSHSSYGIFLGMGLTLAWADRYRLGRVLWSIVSVILLFGLILSFTRFTWFMPLLAAGFVFLFSYSRILPLFNFKRLRKASLLILAVVGSFFIFYLMMNSLYGRRLVASANPYVVRALGTGTLEARLQIDNLFLAGSDSLLQGQGLANTGYFSRKFGFETADVNFHNIFVDMVDSMGLIGLALFLWFLYLLIKQSMITIETQTDWRTRRLLVAVLALILAMLTVGHFNGAVFYFGRALPVYFWAFCGILGHYRAPEFVGGRVVKVYDNH